MLDRTRITLSAASVIVSIIISVVVSFPPPGVKADSQPAAQGAPDIIRVAGNTDPAELLPDRLAGAVASGQIIRYADETIAQLTGESANVYREYRVQAAYSRQYGAARIAVFQTDGVSSAYGLFTYNAGERIASKAATIGWAGSETAGRIVFWKKNYFVCVEAKPGRSTGADLRKLSSAVASLIGGATPEPPMLTSSLPTYSEPPLLVRYFLGPAALSRYVAHASDLFMFDGRAEAVLGEYPSEQPGHPPILLLIVEYHTPQFAYDAMNRANQYLASLPEEEQGKTILKREGNYLVQASNTQDWERAAQLVSSVKYPYQVKWLRNPLWPTNDPFRAQKAAEMLLSTFGVIGLLIMTVLVGGGSFGAFVFMKRRRKLRGVFTDAGGMLHLDIEPLFDRAECVTGESRLKLNSNDQEDW